MVPTQAFSTYEHMLHQARLAESLGYDALWVHEHHSEGEMYPSPLMALAVLAHHTDRVSLGTNMVLLPLYHPLRVAEDAAMVDLLSDGRLILGVAAGYAQDEFDAFGVPLRDRGERMSEGLELLRAVFTRDLVTLQGEKFRLENFSLYPKPVQESGPPIFVGALADSAIRRAARWGDGYVVSAGTSLEQVGERITYYRNAVRELGDDPAGRVIAINRVVHVVKDRAAKAQAEQFFAERFLRLYQTWGHDDIQRLDERGLKYTETSRLHFILGEPSECIETVQRYAEMGVSHIVCMMNFGGPDLDLVEESMYRFAEQVMPHCQSL